ncbi:MAG: Holliday junction branch migration protein RuvA [Candidatus Paraimprobicoccus trichonymphae]|uniref:Holliday junction branch migration complex subunit RuvA n=1 Tax=Candidatus Paraimprobicoccus trichonymphae TaxID=3033793 RepID=A0AA48I668_9FIRM|nr:MAG: Holliday junction branch migration protein RuvA [Candidatus Paraimprobicoccus trichonymphae]
MIYNLNGNLILIEKDFLVVECSGVGYKCVCSKRTVNLLQGKINQKINLFTYLKTGENILDLFGFFEINELNFFKVLISISGVGPKAGLAILSEFSPEQIANIISSNGLMLTKAAGIGKKTAERIVLELKDKFKMKIYENLFEKSENLEEAVKALEILGYQKKITLPILSKLDESLPVEKLIKLFLNSIK